MPKKVKTKQDVVDPQEIIDSFSKNLDSIRIFVSNVEPVAIAYDERVSKKMDSLKSEIREIISTGSEVIASVNHIPVKRIVIPKEVADKAVEGIISILMQHKKLPWITTAQVEVFEVDPIVRTE